MSDGPEVQTKALAGISVKDEEKGEIEAVVATVEIVDRDQEIIKRGAIEPGGTVFISDYAHSCVFGAPPVGKGLIRIKGDEVSFRGKYFMNTDRGVQAFRIMKGIGPDRQEWSVGFHVVESKSPSDEERKRGAQRVLTKLDLFEVSPVLRGAGLNTRTIDAKMSKSAANAAEELAQHFERICARADVPSGLPLPERFGPALRFAAQELGIRVGEIPSVRMVAPSAVRDGGTGMYDIERKMILVVAGLDDSETEATLFHEMSHSWEARSGWACDDIFAEKMEAELLRRWRSR